MGPENQVAILPGLGEVQHFCQRPGHETADAGGRDDHKKRERHQRRDRRVLRGVEIKCEGRGHGGRHDATRRDGGKVGALAPGNPGPERG